MTGEVSPGGGWGNNPGEYSGYDGRFYFDGQNIIEIIKLNPEVVF